jgi:hypothetical protein
MSQRELDRLYLNDYYARQRYPSWWARRVAILRNVAVARTRGHLSAEHRRNPWNDDTMGRTDPPGKDLVWSERFAPEVMMQSAVCGKCGCQGRGTYMQGYKLQGLGRVVQFCKTRNAGQRLSCHEEWVQDLRAYTSGARLEGSDSSPHMLTMAWSCSLLRTSHLNLILKCRRVEGERMGPAPQQQQQDLLITTGSPSVFELDGQTATDCAALSTSVAMQNTVVFSLETKSWLVMM